MHVVVHVLTGDDGSGGAGVLALDARGLVAVPGLLGGELALDLILVVVLVRAVLDRHHVVVVLLRELSLVADRLDRGVVVVLVNLLVNGGLDVLVLGTVDGLVGHGRGNLLVNGGVVVARLRPVIGGKRMT